MAMHNRPKRVDVLTFFENGKIDTIKFRLNGKVYPVKRVYKKWREKHGSDQMINFLITVTIGF